MHVFFVDLVNRGVLTFGAIKMTDIIIIVEKSDRLSI